MFCNLRLRINLATFWRPVGTLASTADSESYEKSIRESLANCVPGIALESPKVLIWRDMVKEPFKYLLSKNSEINHSNPQKALETKFNGDILRILKNEQLKATANLIGYWHGLNKQDANK